MKERHPEISDAAEEQPKSARRYTVKRVLLFLLLGLVILFCIMILVAASLFHRYYSLMEYESVDTSIPSLTNEEISQILEQLYGDESPPAIGSELQEESRTALDESMSQWQEEIEYTEEEEELSNILVIGTDNREAGQSARSDTMILVSINRKTGKVSLISLLRDIYLTIPGYPNNRLNASFAFGGVSLLEQTIRENFGIHIDRYIAIDFSAFQEIIDLLGGIQLELTEQDCANVFPGKELSAGSYTLNGKEALLYARWRHGSSDFNRTERQRIVMQTVINRLLSMSFSELTGVMEQTLPKVRTDLTETDCYSILLHVKSLASYRFDTAYIPFAGTWEYATIDGRSVLTLDLSENRRLYLQTVLGE